MCWLLSRGIDPDAATLPQMVGAMRAVKAQNDLSGLREDLVQLFGKR